MAIVKFAGFKFEGLKLPDGSYAVAVSQSVDLLGVPLKNSSRDFKAILGKGFQFPKISSQLNPKKVNILLTSELLKICRALDKKGNPIASAIVDACVETSIEQAFDIAFDDKKKLEEYQDRIDKRVKGILARRTFTDAIKGYIERHPELSENYKLWIYANVSDALNLAVCGKSSKQLKEERGVKTNELLRDSHDTKTLQEITFLETYAMKLIDNKDIEPLEAVNQAIAF